MGGRWLFGGGGGSEHKEGGAGGREPSEDTSHIMRMKTTEAEVDRIPLHSSSGPGNSNGRVSGI